VYSAKLMAEETMTIRGCLQVRNMEAAEDAAAALLAALGVDLRDESLAETPRRMARALTKCSLIASLTSRRFPTTRAISSVIEREIGFRSLCEHHFLPFVGSAYVAYLPGERILGLSKLARVVELFAHRPHGAGTAHSAYMRHHLTQATSSRILGS
jgi:GTP cyclohydrolase IA